MLKTEVLAGFITQAFVNRKVFFFFPLLSRRKSAVCASKDSKLQVEVAPSKVIASMFAILTAKFPFSESINKQLALQINSRWSLQ